MQIYLFIDFVTNLINDVVEKCSKGELTHDVLPEAPAPLCKEYVHPDKREAVAARVSRYQKVQFMRSII